MHINFYDQNLNPFTQICDFLELNYELGLNQAGQCSFALSYVDSHLTPALFQLGRHIRIAHFADSAEQILFEGIVTAIIQQNDRIVFRAVDYLGYLAYRLIEEEWDYTSGVELNVITTRIFNHTNAVATLPFLMGTNDLTENIKIKIPKGTTALAALQKIAKITGEFRIKNTKLDYTAQTGILREGNLLYNYTDGQSSNILAWEWERNVSEIANRILEKDSSDNFYLTEDADSIAEIGLFAKYVYTSSGATQTVSADTAPLPKITISAERLRWWDYAVGDRQTVQILTPFDYLNLNYTGIVQKISFEMKNGMPKIQILIAEKVKTNANPFEQLSQRLDNLEA